MKQIIWKELRESALWAALGFIALLLSFVFVLTTLYHGGGITTDQPPGTFFNNPDQAYRTYLMWMTLGAPLIASLLGILQVAREQRYDARAFLIHRPVGLGAIYAGKVIAGLGLYLAVILAWVALVTAWFMTPGLYHFPGPFDIRLMLPQLLTTLAAASYYFAGQLVIVRPARIWGSRSLPLVPAALSTVALLMAASVPLAAMAAILFPLALGWAAYGSYASRGEYAPQTRTQRAALGATLLFGATTIVGGAIGLMVTWVNAQRASASVSQRSSDYALTKAGKLVVLNEDWNGSHGEEITSVATLSGRILSAASLEMADYNLLTGYGGYDNQLLVHPGFTIVDYASVLNYINSYALLNNPWPRIVQGDPGADARAERNLTYFYNARQRVLEVFDLAKGRRLGYLGASLNLEPTIEAATPFSSKPLSWVYVNQTALNNDQLFYFPEGIYALHAGSEHLRVLAAAPTGAKFRSAALLSIALLRSDKQIPASLLSQMVGTDNVNYRIVAALAGSEIHLYDSDTGRPVLTIPYAAAADAARYDSVNLRLAANPFRLYALYAANPSKDGFLLRQTSIPAGKTLQSIPLPHTFWQYTSAPSNNATLAAFPLALLAGFKGIQAIESLTDPRPSELFSHNEVHDFLLPALLWCSIGGLISVAVLLLILRPRYGWDKRAALSWSVGIFLLSWPGLLMILAMIPFQQRVLCPHCGRKRILTQSACDHCGVDSLAPKPDGREIFEPSASCEWSSPAEDSAEPAILAH